jgi:hypothetical protein
LLLRTENNDRALRAGGCYGVERCGARKLEASQKCSCHELRWKNCAPIARPEFSEKIWEILASLPAISFIIILALPCPLGWSRRPPTET